MTTTTPVGITCGSCKGKHETVAAVRACYGQPVATAPAAQAASAPKATKPATEKQAAFIQRLCQERAVAAPSFATTAEASAVIEALLTMPKVVAQNGQPTKTVAPVPSGRYAIDHDGTVKFVKVDKVEEGKWAGRTFVKVQASDNEYPIKNPATRAAMLQAIVDQGVQQAMLRYGREIGSCGHCGRTLTNEESRTYGIGPVCRAKMGW